MHFKVHNNWPFLVTLCIFWWFPFLKKKYQTYFSLFVKSLNGIFNFRTLCKQRRLEYWSKLKIAQLRRDYIVCRKQWMFLFNLFTHHTISTQKVAYCFLKLLSIESIYVHFPLFLIKFIQLKENETNLSFVQFNQNLMTDSMLKLFCQLCKSNQKTFLGFVQST